MSPWFRRVLLGAALVLAGPGCVPLTFSHDAALDYEKYRRVRVDVTLAEQALVYGAENATQYLVRELEKGSGFESVVSDPSAKVDLTLNVRVLMLENVTSTDDENLEVDYESEALFSAVDNSGDTVDSGSVFDSSSFPSEAIEDALDEVALHYLHPYRL